MFSHGLSLIENKIFIMFILSTVELSKIRNFGHSYFRTSPKLNASEIFVIYCNPFTVTCVLTFRFSFSFCYHRSAHYDREIKERLF